MLLAARNPQEAIPKEGFGRLAGIESREKFAQHYLDQPGAVSSKSKKKVITNPFIIIAPLHGPHRVIE